jgi:hypothetical protein
MRRLRVDPENTHSFEPGDSVWTINRDQVIRGVVNSVLFELLRDGTKRRLVCTGYRLNIFHLNSRDPTVFGIDEIYASKQAAATMAKWHPVEGFSEDDWNRAIGHEGDEEGFEACELANCYPNSYEIRDILHRCKQQNGLNAKELEQLRAEMERHELDYAADPTDSRPILDKILELLGLKVHVREDPA